MDLWPAAVTVCVVGVVLLVLVPAALRTRGRQADDDDEIVDLPAVPPVRWTPYADPMGPVSGWPHVVDRPEEIPSGSPDDRSSFTDTP